MVIKANSEVLNDKEVSDKKEMPYLRMLMIIVLSI